ncbi:hypothetical protein GALL_22960 [mine drainage metagenome]|uniref:Uncharacterized protein n=1 Tax=mine drainage metagenome TaxID=410659 RepID=A0A1J5TAX6_9ZZZZ
MPNAPLFPQPNVANYEEQKFESLPNEQSNSTGGELLEDSVEKVRRITIKGQIDGD